MISRENNFDLIRLFAAFQVLFEHSLTHLKIGNDFLLSKILHFFPGVLMFFTVSGFLIFSSFDRNKNLKKYFYNRFLRLFPALWLCFFITLILLFYFGVINISSLFSKDLITWSVTQISFFQFWTPDILRDWGVGTPNGSLWTIPVEIQFYIFLPIIVLSFKRIKLIYKFIFLFLISILFNIYISNFLGNGESTLVKISTVSLAPYLYSFIIGAMLYMFWSKIKMIVEGKALYWLIIFLLFCILTNNFPNYYPQNFQLISNILLSILTISLAYTLPKIGKILKGNDISYGMYIYHMLVINYLVTEGYVGNIKFLYIVIVLTTILSIFSWFFVERKVLLLKNK